MVKGVWERVEKRRGGAKKWGMASVGEREVREKGKARKRGAKGA